MSTRSTHSDLARELLAIAARLERLPAGYLVSDGGTLNCIRTAADALMEQDHSIEDMTVKLRELRYGK